uniref:RNA-directed DNA polymerase n=2 Tax=Caenorhabditis tropicalis TaxID=1561998 RepID=A0A1I7TMG4_9PELO
MHRPLDSSSSPNMSRDSQRLRSFMVAQARQAAAQLESRMEEIEAHVQADTGAVNLATFAAKQAHKEAAESDQLMAQLMQAASTAASSDGVSLPVRTGAIRGTRGSWSSSTSDSGRPRTNLSSAARHPRRSFSSQTVTTSATSTIEGTPSVLHTQGMATLHRNPENNAGSSEEESHQLDTAESIRNDIGEPESIRNESSKPESIRSKSSKPESIRNESSKPESIRSKSSKPESIRSKSSKPESLRSSSSKPESIRNDTDQPESIRNNSEPESIRSISSTMESIHVNSKQESILNIDKEMESIHDSSKPESIRSNTDKQESILNKTSRSGGTDITESIHDDGSTITAPAQFKPTAGDTREYLDNVRKTTQESILKETGHPSNASAVPAAEAQQSNTTLTEVQQEQEQSTVHTPRQQHDDDDEMDIPTHATTQPRISEFWWDDGNLEVSTADMSFEQTMQEDCDQHQATTGNAITNEASIKHTAEARWRGSITHTKSLKTIEEEEAVADEVTDSISLRIQEGSQSSSTADDSEGHQTPTKPQDRQKRNILKPPPVHRYRGAPGEDLLDFIREFEDRVSLINLNPRSKRDTLLVYLLDEARDAAEEVIHADPDASYDDVVAKLISRFNNVAYRHKIKEQLRSCKQLETDSVGTFYDKVNHLARRAYKHEDRSTREAVTLNTFLMGLKKKIAFHVYMKQPRSTHEALGYAQQAESAIETRDHTEQQRLVTNGSVKISGGQPVKQQAQEQPTKQRFRGSCHICRRRGHRSDECRSNDQERPSNGQGRAANYSAEEVRTLHSLIQQQDRRIADLTRCINILSATNKPNVFMLHRQWRNDTPAVQQAAANGFLTAQVAVKANGLVVYALMDTGANITVASQNLCSSLGISSLTKDSPYGAIGLGNNHVKLLGSAMVKFNIGSTTKVHKVHFTEEQCTPTAPGSYEIIIGNDLLAKLPKFSFDYDNSKFIIGHDVLHMGHKPWKVKTPNQFSIVVSHDTRIAPGSEQLVQCQINDKPTLVHTLLVEAPEDTAWNILPTVTKSNDIKILISNTSDEELILEKSTRTATGTIVTGSIGCLRCTDVDTTSPQLQTIILADDPEFKIDLTKCEGITEEEKSKLHALVNEFHDVFSKNAYDLGSSKTDPIHIYTSTEVPIKGRPYRVPVKFQAELEDHINGLLKSGRITESNTPWTSPIVLVKKKNGSLRVCLDFRKLNEITIPDNYPLPRIDTIVEKVGHSKFFTSLDMANGYLQLRLDAESSYKCGFVTEKRVYAYTHLPFGLKSAASYFQRALKTVLAGLDEEVLLYIDDVLIYSKTFEEHLATLRKVLERFRIYSLKASPKKCEFVRRSIVFLGHEINADNYTPNQANIEAIKKLPTPTNISELRRFVGMCGFFRKFVKGFSEITEPLTKLTRKEVPFVWTKQQQEAVDKLKKILTSKPVLAFPDYTKEFHVFTDASAVAQGAVLTQTNEKDPKMFQALAYASRTLTERETRRAAVENELGGIIFALRHFKPYLYQSEVKLHTDHRPLAFLLAKHKIHDTLARWLVELQGYRIEIMHIDGKKNTVADCLSRDIDKTTKAEELEDIINFPVCMPAGYEALVFNAHGKDKGVNLQEEQDNDPEIAIIKNFLTKPSTPIDGLSELWSPILEFVRMSPKGILVVELKGERKTIVPEKLRRLIFESFHSNVLSGGHLCARKSLQKAQRRYFWPNMKANFHSWARECIPCQRKRSQHPSRREPQSIVLTSAIFEKVGVDLTGPFIQSTRGNKYVINAICWFSKYVIAVPLPDAKTESIVKALLEEVVFKHGTPSQIVSDNATSFTSAAFKSFCQQLNVGHHLAIPHHSRGNGATERTFRTFKYVNDTHTDWDTILPGVVFAYNTAVHSTTRETPFFLMFGRDPIFVVDQIVNPPEPTQFTADEWKTRLTETLQTAWKAAASQSETEQQARQKIANDGAKGSTVQVGDRVMVKNYSSQVNLSKKLISPWTGDYRVLEINDSEATLQDLINPNKKLRRMHLDQMKKFYTPEEVDTEEADNEQLVPVAESSTEEEDVIPDPHPAPVVKRGRGRPRKQVQEQQPVTSKPPAKKTVKKPVMDKKTISQENSNQPSLEKEKRPQMPKEKSSKERHHSSRTVGLPSISLARSAVKEEVAEDVKDIKPFYQPPWGIQPTLVDIKPFTWGHPPHHHLYALDNYQSSSSGVRHHNPGLFTRLNLLQRQTELKADTFELDCKYTLMDLCQEATQRYKEGEIEVNYQSITRIVKKHIDDPNAAGAADQVRFIRSIEPRLIDDALSLIQKTLQQDAESIIVIP